jgi:hypothetical protein
LIWTETTFRPKPHADKHDGLFRHFDAAALNARSVEVADFAEPASFHSIGYKSHPFQGVFYLQIA